MSAKYPVKMQELRDLMFGEFANQVLPLDALAATRFVAPRPSLAVGRRIFNYSGDPITGIPLGAAPQLLNTKVLVGTEFATFPFWSPDSLFAYQ